MNSYSNRAGRRRHASTAKCLAITCILATVRATAADTTVVQWDWDTRTASCPPKVTQSTRIIVRVTGINDVLVDFRTHDLAEYQFRAKGSPVSVVPAENPFVSGAPAAAIKLLTTGCTDVSTHLDDAIRSIAADPAVAPQQPGGTSIPVMKSVDAARFHKEVTTLESDYANSACHEFFASNSKDERVQWLVRLEGTHSVDFNVDLEPNQNYQFTLQEFWRGKATQGGTLQMNCGETDILSMSIGPLVTTLPYRTYNHQKAPVPAGSSTTQDILSVGGNSNVNILGAALLNYHLPQIPFLPVWMGLTLSAGPVYKLGTAPSVSSLGLFVGGSIHLYRSFFLTPGVHIGEFADFPAGFYPGATIPSQFGDLTPVKRTTAHFAIGVTFKTNSFKKSNQDSGAAKNTATTGSGQQKKSP